MPELVCFASSAELPVKVVGNFLGKIQRNWEELDGIQTTFAINSDRYILLKSMAYAIHQSAI